MGKEVNNSYGVASLVVSILSILLIIAPYIALPLAICGFVFAKKQNKIEETMSSTSGYVISIIGIVLNTIVLLLLVVYLLMFGFPQ